MRLTGKNKVGRYGFITENNTLGIFDENSLADKCYTKLGQLEDMEDELGIDLVTLIKVLTAGKLAVRHDAHFNDGKVHTHNVYKIEIIKRLKAIHITWSTLWIGDNNLHNNNIYYFEDYGKTWALTKEELKDE